jgi:hypothetical protein
MVEPGFAQLDPTGVSFRRLLILARLEKRTREVDVEVVALLVTDDEQTLRDVFYAGYHLNGNPFIAQTAENIRTAEHREGHRERLMELLDESVVAADNADVGGFILRYRGEDGRMHEVEFGREEQSELSEPAEPANVTWQAQPSSPPSGKPKRPRKKRPGKAYGRNKKSKRKRR